LAESHFIMSESAATIWAEPEALCRYVGALFCALGLSKPAADRVAEALVDADLEGIESHGIMLVPMYAERIRAGSVSLASEGRIVSDQGSAIVLDAMNALGQVTAVQAVALVTARARVHGLAAVAVRNGFHFGTAGRWATAIAGQGQIGIGMSNTRPLMPAPGGAERVVGNNPLAIALPTEGDIPVVLDMASSAGAMGKIRLAEAEGRRIPEGWATDAVGVPTTDPGAAIKGMLLPAGGPKGFGLAFMIDLLCGGLSEGAVGDAVRPLYGDAAEPYGCAHFFLAIEVARFRALPGFAAAVEACARHIREAALAPGVSQLFSPGEPAWRARQANKDRCPISVDTATKLQRLGASLGVSSAGIFQS